MSDTKLYPSIKEKLLKTDVLSSDTAVKLRDIVWYTTSDGTDTNLTAADFGDVAYGVFEPRTARQEFFTWDPTTITSATTTGITTTARGLKPGANYTTEIPGLKFNHPTGSKVVLFTNAPAFYNDFANKDNDETITETWTFTEANRPKLTVDLDTAVVEELVTFGQLARQAVSGAPNASTVVKGIIQIPTAAERGNGTAIGSTGAILVPSNDALVKTSSGAGDENKIPVLNASGELAAGFIDNASTTARGQVEVATAAETVAGTGTGGTGAVLVPDNANFKAVASTTISNDTSKVPVTSATTGILDQLFLDGSGTSGEALAIGDALYIKASDSKLYKADGNAASEETTYSFVGICQTTAGAADVTVRFARPGQIASGLAGLTAGSYYYISDTAGALATTPGTRYAKVGQAMSTTTLRVIEPKFIARGTQTIAIGAGNTTVTTGFYPAHVEIRAGLNQLTVGKSTGFSMGDDSNNCVFDYVGTGQPTFTNNAWELYDTDGIEARGTVSAKSATGFTLAPAVTTKGCQIQWVAYSE